MYQEKNNEMGMLNSMQCTGTPMQFFNINLHKPGHVKHGMEAFLGDKIRNNDESLGALDESVEITLLVYKEDNKQ